MRNQIGLIFLALITTRSSILSIQSRQGLPLGTQVTGWLVLISSLTVPFLHTLEPNNDYLHRIFIIFLTFSPTFIILTISYEGLFYFAFCLTLLTWVRLEHKVYLHEKRKPTSASAAAAGAPNGSAAAQNGAPPNSLQRSDTAQTITPALAQPAPARRALALSDLRVSLFSLFLLHSAFFSTGNIASVSSFSLDAVYRLIPVFDPFAQGALLVFKILVPFALLSAHITLVNRMVGLAPGAVFLGLISVGDYGTLRFFWAVKDEGSWLEIGTSISEFVIGSGLGMFVAGLEGVGEGVMRGVAVPEDDYGKESSSGEGSNSDLVASGVEEPK